MTAFILLGIIGQTELIVILVVALLLFGGKKIPELMRGFGKGIKEFKDGMNGEANPKDTTKEKENL